MDFQTVIHTLRAFVRTIRFCRIVYALFRPPVVCLLLLPLIVFSESATASQTPRRIISMSPAITEILFELGANDRIVGVSDHSDYPEAAKAIPRVGSFVSPNFEVIVSLQPDLILHEDNTMHIVDKARTLGIPVESIALNNIHTILNSILKVGGILEVGERARVVHDRMASAVESYATRLKGRAPKPVLLIFDESAGSTRQLYAVAKGSFLDELLTLAGGRNIITDSRIPLPKISPEFVVEKSPELIIELLPGNHSNAGAERAKREWGRFPGIPAVRNNNIRFLLADHMGIPGPRVLNIIEDFARVMHPDLFASPSPSGAPQ